MLINHINKDGFVYRNAYPFNKPAQVRICLLPYRFIVFGLTRLFLSLVVWLVLGAAFVAFLGTSLSFILFLMGYKFADYSHGQFKSSFIIGRDFLDRLIVFNYKAVPINRLPVLAGRKILPWHILAAISVPFALWYIVPAAGSAIANLWSWVAFLDTEFMEMNLWIPVLLFTAFVATSLVVCGIYEFRKNEAYGLLKMFIRARIDKVCPIVPVK